MTYWCVRENLSLKNKLRRSYYELLRDDLDHYLLQHALIDSYQNFVENNIEYPFVEMRELKPRARIPDVEYEHHNAFLILFLEDALPPTHKKHIRFLDDNKTTKANLLRSKTLSLSGNFNRNLKFLDSVHFTNFLNTLLPVDYALLIQKDPDRTSTRYYLSHYHVRIDWPIADAAETLAIGLRYISQDLYEKGDKYAEDMQKKFFEYYGLQFMAGGRRTAAIVAAEYLKKIPCIHTVYASSSESRALFRICETNISKTVLLKMSHADIEKAAEANGLTITEFRENYIVVPANKGGICLFRATYKRTDSSRPPDDGKLRDLKVDLFWRSVSGQHILPGRGKWDRPPLQHNIIYS